MVFNLNRENILIQIEAIIEEVYSESLHTNDNLLGWLEFDRKTNIPSTENIKLLNLSIFNGLSGILILLCGHQTLNTDKYISFRKKLFKTIFTLMQRQSTFTHGYAGNISYLYAMSLYHKVFKDDQSYLAIEELVKYDYSKLFLYKKLDIVDGASGTLLILISLSQEFMGNVNWNTLIKKFANHIYENVINKFLHKNIFYGFAHGYSGIAYALARVYEIYREKKFLILAIELLKEEDDFFSKNSPFTDDMYTWCNGLSGMITTRLFLASISDYQSAFNLEDFEYKISNINTSIVHLCCGQGGNKECISLLSLENNIKYNIKIYPDNLSFFHGKVGIAYALCRTLNKKLPNINFLTTTNIRIVDH